MKTITRINKHVKVALHKIGLLANSKTNQEIMDVLMKQTEPIQQQDLVDLLTILQPETSMRIKDLVAANFVIDTEIKEGKAWAHYYEINHNEIVRVNNIAKQLYYEESEIND